MSRILYSFVVDRGSKFAYQAWHLAHSLVTHCGALPSDIHIQCTPTADVGARQLFDAAGFRTHTLTPFGDKKYCNKLAQIENLPCDEALAVVLLDTDTIAVGDLRTWISGNTIRAKAVDFQNPPLDTLREIASLAELEPGDICTTDAGEADTLVGNCNGGMYAIPGYLARRLSAEWKRWANWLLAHPEPLRRVNREIHVDQVSFWLALRATGLPFELAPSNANYFTHVTADRRYMEHDCPIALLHYHDKLNVLGKLDALAGFGAEAESAIARANAQIGANFNNRLFWEFRYDHFPERGSGVGSRGDNLIYKRDLLRANGIEDAASVLDIGCGDLEVIKPLSLRGYTGVDMSPLAIQRGKEIFPNGIFVLGLQPEIPAADFVLCFEVLIHQHDISDYRKVISFASERTNRTMLISGYAANNDAISHNTMVFFHEALADSLARTGKFSSITEIGYHTDVVIYRCDV